MANEKNLVPLNKRTKSEQRKIASEGGKASGEQDKVSVIVAKIVDMEREVDAGIDGLRSIKREVEDAIAQVPDGSQRKVLTMRYINGLRWEEIAVRLNYHYRWVLELHGRGLQAVEKNMEMKQWKS